MWRYTGIIIKVVIEHIKVQILIPYGIKDCQMFIKIQETLLLYFQHIYALTHHNTMYHNAYILQLTS